ncbi:putative target SNARE coiled-coil domain, Zinc finger C2H2-type [Plasmopara halstedii]
MATEEVSEREWEQRHTQALRDTAESLQLGRSTAQVLSMQTEQINRSEKLVDETQATVAITKRVLRGMTWSGWIYNKFSTVPQFSDNNEQDQIAMGFICPDCKVKFQSADQLGRHYNNIHTETFSIVNEVSALKENRSQSIQEQQKRVVEVSNDIHEIFLKNLEPQLAELKEQALALGGALDAQNEKLDQLDTKIGRVQHDLKQVRIEADKLSGRKSHVIFKFRCAFQELQSGKFLRDVNGEPLLSADVVVDGCTYRAYTRGDDSDVWGFQSEKSSCFLGINRYGSLKIQGRQLNSYEQFLVENKSSTHLFCMSSYFGLGGWIATNESIASGRLTIIRGTPENKLRAASFRIVYLEDERKKK